ncbi:MAG: Ig-like domain-containing protein, partial [Myxococcota bacterium]
SPPFEAQVQEFNADSGVWLQTATLQPAGEGEGYVLGPQGLAVDENTVWVVAQDSEVLIGLNKEDLAETVRIPTIGGPRSILIDDRQTWVHSALTMQVHKVVEDSVVSTTSTGADPRPAELAAGLLHYVRPGESYGQNFSCNSCHYDGRGDTQVWRAGPFETWELSRPMMWLEGTAPLGWGAYVNDTQTFGYTGFASIIAKWPTNEMGEELGTFLQSLVPPPKANGLTQRDGQLSAAALDGKEIFEGKAGCTGCHSGPLSTTNQTFEEGITEGRVSTPSLVGAYRHRAWLKDGSAHSLEEATRAAAEWAGVTDLSDEDVDAIGRYLRELTDRDFFVLGHEPVATRTFIGVDEPIVLIFNQPVWTGEDNLALFSVVNDAGETVAIDRSVEGRRVTLTPQAPLNAGSSYTAIVDAGVESFDERSLTSAVEVDFMTAASSTVAFVGRYTLTVDLPAFDFEIDAPNPDVTIAMVNPFEAELSASGSDIVLELNDGLTWNTEVIIQGVDFEIPAMPIRAANSLAQGSAITGSAEDTDSDGIVDYATGTFVVSGPGFHIEDVVWTIEPEAETVDCAPGSEGTVAVEVNVTDDGIDIGWGEQGALGLYVTTYGADLPLGPGAVVSNGEAFWAIGTTAFPSGFYGPISYGELPEGASDISEENGAPLGGAELEAGNCYQFSVITDAFQIGSYTIVL